MKNKYTILISLFAATVIIQWFVWHEFAGNMWVGFFLAILFSYYLEKTK